MAKKKNHLAAERQFYENMLEKQKLIVDCSQTFLQRKVLTIFLVFSEDDVSTVPVKRSLAERLGKKVEAPGNADKAPKRDPGTKQASGLDSWVLYLVFLFVLFQ